MSISNFCPKLYKILQTTKLLNCNVHNYAFISSLHHLIPFSLSLSLYLPIIICPISFYPYREIVQAAQFPLLLIQGRLEGAVNSHRHLSARPHISYSPLVCRTHPTQGEVRSRAQPTEEGEEPTGTGPGTAMAHSTPHRYISEPYLSLQEDVNSPDSSGVEETLTLRLPWQPAWAAPTPSAPLHNYVTPGRCLTDISVND